MGWNFCKFWISVGGVVAITKQGVVDRSENFKQIKSKKTKVAIISCDTISKEG